MGWVTLTELSSDGKLSRQTWECPWMGDGRALICWSSREPLDRGTYLHRNSGNSRFVLPSPSFWLFLFEMLLCFVLFLVLGGPCTCQSSALPLSYNPSNIPLQVSDMPNNFRVKEDLQNLLTLLTSRQSEGLAWHLAQNWALPKPRGAKGADSGTGPSLSSSVLAGMRKEMMPVNMEREINVAWARSARVCMLHWLTTPKFCSRQNKLLW